MSGSYILSLLFGAFLLLSSTAWAQPAPGEFLEYFIDSGAIDNVQDLLIGPSGDLLVLTRNRSSKVLRFDLESGEYIDTIVEAPASPNNALIRMAGFALGADSLLYLLNATRQELSIHDGISGTFIDVIDFGEEDKWGTDFYAQANNGIMTIGPDGHLYLSTYNTHEVLRFDTQTRTLDVFVERRSGTLFNPTDITFGPDGHLYVVNELTKQLFRYNGQTGAFIDIFIEEFPDSPRRDIAFGPNGNFHVLEQARSTVRSFDGASGEEISPLIANKAGNLTSPSAFLFGPDNQLYIDTRPLNSFTGSFILRFDASTGAFSDPLVPRAIGTIDQPFGITIGPDTHFYVTSFTNHEVLRFDGDTGEFIDVFVPPDTGGLEEPFDLDFGPDGHLYVSSFATDAVLRFDGTTGVFIDAFVPTRSGELEGPGGLEFGEDGHLYVSSFHTDEVLRFDGETGVFIDAFVTRESGGLFGAHGLRFGPDGHLYVGSFQSDEILRYDGSTGAFIDAFVPANTGNLDGPQDHQFGPDGHLYVTSLFSNSILRYNGESGEYMDSFIPLDAPIPYGPRGLLFGPDNDLFVVSISRDRVFRYASPLNTSTSTDSPYELPKFVQLGGNYPNPFSESTRIEYALDRSSHVRLSIYDLAGRLIETLIDQHQPPGAYNIEFQSNQLPAGMYFYRLQTEEGIQAGKMVLIR